MTEPGGLAAFFAQPADEEEPEDVEIAYDEPHTTYPVEDLLAAFYAQPSDDEVLSENYNVDLDPYVDEDVPNTADTPEVDGFLAGLETNELTDELARRLGSKGYVTGLVVQTKGEPDRLVWLDEMGLAP